MTTDQGSTLSTDELRRRAQAWADEALVAPRWRLERVDERCCEHGPSRRSSYRARFRAWEVAGAARVLVGPQGQPLEVAFPSDVLEGGDLAPLPARPDTPLIMEAALARARRTIPDDPLAARAALWRRARGGAEVAVVVERAQPDGELVIDLDATTGERLGLLARPLLRGSTRSAALGRRAAVAHARAQAPVLPPGARLGRARLAHTHLGRVWRVRWDGDDEALVVTLHARSGRLCGWERVTRGAPSTQARTRAEAAAALRLAVDLRVGPAAHVSPPLLGARGGRQVWMAVVHAPGGRLFRALLDRGRVELVRRDAGAVGRTA